MAKRGARSQPSWMDVKAKLAAFDRQGLLGLIQELYAAHKDNRVFLHARFGLGDVLDTYKETLDRWLWPDVRRNQGTSAVKAKQAIAAYGRAAGDLPGLAELMVFYCESAVGFCNDVGYDDASYLNALVNMFEQAVETVGQLPEDGRDALLARLKEVRLAARDIGYGVGDDIDSLWAAYRKR